MRLSRRKFLGGAGVVVALPALELLHARRAYSQPQTPPRRLLVYFMPNGRIPGSWIPNEIGDQFTLKEASRSLEPFKGDLTFMSGLYHTAAMTEGAGDHAKGTGPILTCKKMTSWGTPTNDISMDQALVKALSPSTRFPSLQWGVGQPNASDFAASGVYTQCISWAGVGAPLSPVCNARTAFNQLFAGADEGATAAAQATRRASLSSVLDYVLSDAKGLQGELGADDRQKLDEYFTSVRELERRITQPAGAACEVGQPPGDGLEYPDQVKAFNDLIMLAFQCDQTQVITFMIEYGLSNRTHPFIDAPGGHHLLSHDQSEGGRQQLLRLETWQCEQAAYLAQRLKSATEADGSSMLDNTAMLILPDMGLGDAHDHTNIAPVLLGKCGGALKTGQSLRFDAAPLGNLYVSLLQAFGVSNGSFGMDGVAPLPGLAA